MSEFYRHEVGQRLIDDERLIRVATKVRDWLGLKQKEGRVDPVAVSPLT